MKYIDQINVFWLLDAEHSFKGNESRLYFYLLKLSNSLFWKNPLTNADEYTAAMVGISVNTLKTIRNKLQQAGLIRFKTGGNGAGNKCTYWIVPAEEIINKVSKNDTLNEIRYQNLTPNPQPYVEPNPQPYPENIDDINRQRIRVRPDNNFSVSNETEPQKNDSDPGQGISSRKRKKKKSSAQKKKEDQEDTTTVYWQVLVKVWFDFYQEKEKHEPSFKGRDPKSLKFIIDSLQKRAITQQKDWNEQNAVDTLLKFLTHAYSLKWIHENFLLSNLETQFDKIVADAISPKKQSTGPAKQTGNQRNVSAAFAAIDSLAGKT